MFLSNTGEGRLKRRVLRHPLIALMASTLFAEVSAAAEAA